MMEWQYSLGTRQPVVKQHISILLLMEEFHVLAIY